MSATSASVPAVAEHGFFADLYTFDWTKLSFRTSLICSLAIAVSLVAGVLVGHPSAGLIAGGVR